MVLDLHKERSENMPYIPKQHKKYNLLPYCRKDGGEVFDYPSELICKAEKLLEDEYLMPYNYDSYEGYYEHIDNLICKYQENPQIVEVLTSVKTKVRLMNVKEEWSVLKYIGPTDDAIFGLTHNKNYYWPTRKDNPIYCGVIDDEEFTSYLYPTEAHLWEILDDPTGMAYNTIYGNGKGKLSIKEHEEMIEKFSDVLKDK